MKTGIITRIIKDGDWYKILFKDKITIDEIDENGFTLETVARVWHIVQECSIYNTIINNGFIGLETNWEKIGINYRLVSIKCK